MKSIFFRAFEENDYLLINQWRNDPKIQALTGKYFRYVSSLMEKEWVKDKMMHNTKDIYLSICLNDESKKMIGYISINDIDYVNRTACQGGLVLGDPIAHDGTIWIESILSILEYNFNHLNMNRVYGNSLVEHKLTRIMCEASFQQMEGVGRQAVYKDGRYHDIYFWGLLREDYFRHKEAGDYEVNAMVKRVIALRKKYKNQ
ncbi:MAG: GNAT family N-acetyltransferase [Culturomica sp.]|jgi:RimJ/RimL family protein N-acetyltransferase|nr:GNAT family N-acetyltransferase [Culturomica sp.]